MFDKLKQGKMNWGKLMTALSPLIMGKDPKEHLPKLIKEFATDENIKVAGSMLMETVNNFQKKYGNKFVLHVETTGDNTDLVITIWARNELTMELNKFKSIHLSQLNQNNINQLLSV